MRNNKRMMAVMTAAIMLCSVISFVLTCEAATKSPVAIEGVRFDVGTSMKDNLKSLIGKDVYVHLQCGKTLQGFVKSVGDNLVHLEKLAGKDFFDALVLIDDVTAVEVKFRDIK